MRACTRGCIVQPACAAARVSLTVRQLDPENPPQGPRHGGPLLRRRDSPHSPRARAPLCASVQTLNLCRSDPSGSGDPVCEAKVVLPLLTAAHRCLPLCARAFVFVRHTVPAAAWGRVSIVREEDLERRSNRFWPRGWISRTLEPPRTHPGAARAAAPTHLTQV